MIKKQKNYLWKNNLEGEKELAEEGIDLLSIPWVSKDN